MGKEEETGFRTGPGSARRRWPLVKKTSGQIEREAQDVPDVVISLKLGSSGRFATTRSDFQVRKKESLGVVAWFQPELRCTGRRR